MERYVDNILDMIHCGIDKEDAIDSCLADIESEDEELTSRDIERLRKELADELQELSHSHYHRIGMSEEDFL